MKRLSSRQRAARFAASALALMGLASCAQAQVFASSSPWNVAIPANAVFANAPAAPNIVAEVDSWDAGNSWTIPNYTAGAGDRLRPLLYNRLAWYKVFTGEWRRGDNAADVEAEILAASSNSFPYPGNVFSSTSTISWVLPASYNKTLNPSFGPAQFRFGDAARPASAADGHMTVTQPNGSVLETYSTIMLSGGQVVALSYSVTSPTSAGDGWQNG